ncbi:MAG: hypothetical protein EBS87_12180, partial [Sphingomonadaceae bacterium]|nr:hypothetical protein [Sphingomonadaceae bacterium]
MEADYEPEFSVSPSDVLRNAGAEPQQKQEPQGYYPAQSMAFKQAGMNPLSAVAPLFMPQSQRAQMGPRAMGGSGGGGGGEQKAPSPFAKDADFYANKLGDMGAAQSLMGSKEGRNVFQMYEDHDFDLGEGDESNPSAPSGRVKMRIVPKGDRQGVGPDGKPFKVPVHVLAHQNGITNVPFKGGDESADRFRALIGTSQGLLKNLNDLEKIYKANPILTSIGYSEDSSKARGLEARVLLDFSRIMSEAKALQWAKQPEALEAIRQKMQEKLPGNPLFDSVRQARGL